MKGFFNLNEIEIDEPTIKKKKVVKEVYYSCEQCGLYKNCNSPKMSYSGTGKSGILLVVDPPTVKADRIGEPLVGEYKHIVKDLCKRANIAYEDLYIINALQCRHTKTNKASIPSCRIRLREIIQELKPKSIIALGGTALEVLLGDRESTSVENMEGYEIPYIGYETVIYPTYGTKDLIIEKYNTVVEKKMLQAFIKAQNPHYVNYESMIDVMQVSELESIDVLNNMTYEELVAFDYETTGIQPYKSGHEIISMSVSNDKKAYAFLVTENNKNAIRDFLTSKVKKIAHNAKYEMIWSKAILGVEVNNLVADTMLIAHSLNNTSGIVGLKFQTFVNFGIAGYGDEIKQLFTGDNVHSFNQLYYMKHKGELLLIKDKLLHYNGIDSLVTCWLYQKQLKQLEQVPHLQQGIDLFLEGTKAFADIEYNGMNIDSEKVDTNIELVTKQLEILQEAIYETAEVKQYDSNTFNFTSNQDLAHLLYDILQYPVYKTTPGGTPSVDKEALDRIIENEDSELLTLLLKYRKLLKIRDTYLKGIKTGVHNNKIYPSFNLHVAKSYRSSSSGAINFQNIPKHDKTAKNMIRTVFKPSKGNVLEELDFSGLEVNIGQCYNQDDNLLLYLTDENHNMHTDTGCTIFSRTKETLLKEERHITKNGLVFPIIYGSTATTCAKNMWDRLKKPTVDHLYKNGVKNLADFTERVKEAEYEFWNVRFKKWGEWKKENWKLYLRNGYIDFHTGFRSTIVMSPMQAGNIAIQGSAFHCLLYTLVHLHKYMKDLGLRSRIIGQIHDSIILDLDTSEAEIIHKLVKRILDKLRSEWLWVTVQLTMDYEQTPIDGDWSQLEEKGHIRSA